MVNNSGLTPNNIVFNEQGDILISGPAGFPGALPRGMALTLGPSGYILASNGTTEVWIPYTPNPGTVTSVAINGLNGVSASSTPITSSGTINVSLSYPTLTQNGGNVTGSVDVATGGFTLNAPVATGTVSSITLTSSDLTLAGTNPITTSGTIDLELATQTLTPGTYNVPTVTVNSKGIITAISTGGVNANQIIGNISVSNFNSGTNASSSTFLSGLGTWLPLTGILSSALPQPLGVASAGINTLASRDDHVHPLPTATAVGALPITGGTLTGSLIISGNLTVNGTMTTINSNTLDVADKNIVMGVVSSPTNATANGGGIQLQGTTTKSIIWSTSDYAWTSSENFNLVSGLAYYINDVSVLNATTLGSSVVNSSLTSVGTLANLTVTAPISGSVTGTSANITATSNATLTTLSSLALPTTQLTGILAASQFPALTGDVTTTAGSLATTISANAVTTSAINNSAVTYAKLQNETASTLLGNPTGSSAAPSEITLGSGLFFSGTTLVSTGTGGTVTSVGLSDTSTTPIYSVSNSPVTASGTIDITLDTQTANTIFAGPSSGPAAQPTFRAIVPLDIPTLNQDTTGNAATVTTNANLTGDVTSIGNATTLIATTNSTLTTLSALSLPYSQLSGAVPTWNQNTTGQSGTVATISGLVTPGANISITGAGTSASPYNISALNSYSIITTAGPSTAASSTIIFNGPTTYTLTMPSSPVDGQLLKISAVVPVAGFTLLPNAGQTLTGVVPTSIATSTNASASILATAAKFAVLAGASITNTGSSIVTGDVGAVSSITTGPWTVTGIVHTVNDSATTQALSDATNAFNELNLLPSTTLTGDLGGQTLTPGVYSYPSSAALTGTLTLDFGGLSNQQIVIITGSTLTTAAASVVNVVNSNASNQVIWVIGSSATLGASTSFVGTILADVSITFTTGANMSNGSAIALTGSVVMDTDAINIPTFAVSATVAPIEYIYNTSGSTWFRIS